MAQSNVMIDNDKTRVTMWSFEIGEETGVPSYLIDDASMLDTSWLKGVGSVGVTAGASAPEELVTGVINRLSELANTTVRNLEGVTENIVFKLPQELREDKPLTEIA